MDEESFRQLYDETARGLRSYLRHVLGDRALADDIFQEAYFRMFKTQLPPNMESKQQKSYLYKVATNLIRDQRAARRVQQLTEEHDMVNVAPIMDDARDVRRAFGQLKTKERDLLWLAYVECFRHDEIAQVVNTTPATIRPMLARARDKFRKILRRRGFGGPHGQ